MMFMYCYVLFMSFSFIFFLHDGAFAPRYELQVDPPQIEVPSTPKTEPGPCDENDVTRQRGSMVTDGYWLLISNHA